MSEKSTTIVNALAGNLSHEAGWRYPEFESDKHGLQAVKLTVCVWHALFSCWILHTGYCSRYTKSSRDQTLKSLHKVLWQHKLCPLTFPMVLITSTDAIRASVCFHNTSCRRLHRVEQELGRNGRAVPAVNIQATGGGLSTCRRRNSCRIMISLVSRLSSRIFSRMVLGTSGTIQRIIVIRNAITFCKTEH